MGEGEFFVRLLLMASLYGIGLFLINKFTSTWLTVKKKKLFSNDYVNDKHKKIDRMIRISFVFFVIIVCIINISRQSLNSLGPLQIQILLSASIIASEIVRILMEKRYSENKNDYIFTAIHLAALSIFLLSTLDLCMMIYESV